MCINTMSSVASGSIVNSLMHELFAFNVQCEYVTCSCSFRTKRHDNLFVYDDDDDDDDDEDVHQYETALSRVLNIVQKDQWSCDVM